MFRLAHISDPHLGPLPKVGFSDLASKRAIGYFNWRRNRQRAFAPSVLMALAEDMRAAAPDHVAVTGDLVNLGLTAEFAAARLWLGEIGEPDAVTVIPGNHDAYVPGAFEELIEAWHPYMTGDNSDVVTFPFIRKRGPVAIVGTSSAVATAPLMATGEIGAGQAAALASRLTALGRAGLFRVVLIHHAPVARSSHWHRRLVDADLFRRAIAEAGAELILHGHNHTTLVDSLPSRHGAVPVVGVAAASVLPHGGRPGGSYCLFTIDGEPGNFSCEMVERGLTTRDGTVDQISAKRLIGSAPGISRSTAGVSGLIGLPSSLTRKGIVASLWRTRADRHRPFLPPN
jgi:3',5'-cyclic AMP phosphodiesterase CpdA